MSLADNLPARDASLQSLLASVASGAIATGVSGVPAAQTMSVQGNNERLLVGPVSLTAAGTFFEVDLSGNANPFNMVAVNILAVGAGGYITLQGCNEPPTYANRVWNIMQQQAGVNTNVSGGFSAVGGGYAPIPYAYARLVLTGTAITGTYTIDAFFTKNMAPLRSVAAKGDPAGYAVTGSPIGVGYCARATLQANVSDNFAVAGVGTLDGVGVQKPFSIPQMDWGYAAAGAITTASAVTIRAAGAAGVRSYLTALQLDNASTGTGAAVAVRDGAGGTVLWQGYVAAGRSRDITFPTPRAGSAARLMEVAVLSDGAAIYVNAQGYVSGAMA